MQNGSVNVDSVVTVAARLAEAGHYGAERIAMVSSQLQEDWKSLTTALEERSNTLAMATGFHQGAEQVFYLSFTFLISCLSLPVHIYLFTCLQVCLPVDPQSPHVPVLLVFHLYSAFFLSFLFMLAGLNDRVPVCLSSSCSEWRDGFRFALKGCCHRRQRS